MYVRSVVALTALLGALVPASADACGMRYRGDAELLVQLKSIQPVAEPNQSLVEVADEVIELADSPDPFKLTHRPERSALARTVAERLAEVTPAVSARPRS